MSELTSNGAIAIAEGQQRVAFVTSLNDDVYVGQYHDHILRRDGLDVSDLQDAGRLYGGTPQRPRIEIIGGPFQIPFTPTPAGRRQSKRILERLVAGHKPPIPVIIR